MNIDPSRLTYSPWPKPTPSTQNVRNDLKKTDSSKIKQKEEVHPSSAKEIKTPESQSTKQADWTSPLSHYLSPEEKAMLTELFPPPGRDIGIRAYRRGQQPVRNELELGKRIDLKT